MKNLVLISAILFLSNSLLGQTENSKKKFNHEIGINITNLIDKIIVLSDQYSSLPDDYFLIYKYHLENFSFRARMGGYFNSYNRENSLNQNPTNRKGKNSEFNIALGIERRSKFNSKWSYNYGLESIYHHNYWLRTNVGTGGENPEIKDTTIDMGFGVLLGFNYSIKSWLSIGSESTFRFLSSTITSKYEYMDTSNNEEGSRKKTDSSFIPSNGIFLKIHF